MLPLLVPLLLILVLTLVVLMVVLVLLVPSLLILLELHALLNRNSGMLGFVIWVLRICPSSSAKIWSLD
jgi:hypothetical protein